MTSKRLRIGVLIGDVSGTFYQPQFRGLRAACEKFHCDLVIFEGRELNGISHPSEKQHNIVYQLISEKNVDGIISGGDIFNSVSKERKKEFIQQLPPVPVIALNSLIPNTTAILLEDSAGIKSLMSHLIEDHRYRRIAFVTGPNGNDEALSRYKAFEESMRYYKLEINPDYIIEGNFRPAAGVAAAKKIVKMNPRPEVVVCANDDMAMTCCLELERLEGKGILKEIAVTGFDDAASAKLMDTPLTTIRQPIDALTEASVKALLDLIKGKKLPRKIRIGTELIIRQSCGCEHVTTEHPGADSSIQLNGFRVHDHMQASHQQELLDQLTETLPFFDIHYCYIAIYEHRFFNFGTPPPRSTLIYAMEDSKRRPVKDQYIFSTNQLIPDEFTLPETAIVREIFFQKEHFGYMVFDGVAQSETYYEEVRGQFCNMFKSVTLISELKQAYSKLENLSITDELTNLLNRRGLYKNLNEILATPLENKDIIVCFADMDGLKQINDSFGHDVGDQAIRTIADTLKSCFPDAVLGRLGGDEFLLILTLNPEERLWRRIRHLKNELSQKTCIDRDGYLLDISLGASRASHFSNPDEKQLLKAADQRLYQRKIIKKRIRIKNSHILFSQMTQTSTEAEPTYPSH